MHRRGRRVIRVAVQRNTLIEECFWHPPKLPGKGSLVENIAFCIE